MLSNVDMPEACYRCAETLPHDPPSLTLDMGAQAFRLLFCSEACRDEHEGEVVERYAGRAARRIHEQERGKAHE